MGKYDHLNLYADTWQGTDPLSPSAATPGYTVNTRDGIPSDVEHVEYVRPAPGTETTISPDEQVAMAKEAAEKSAVKKRKGHHKPPSTTAPKPEKRSNPTPRTRAKAAKDAASKPAKSAAPRAPKTAAAGKKD